MAITTFEVYETSADKRKAQRGAKRGKPTGKAVEYLQVDSEDRSGAVSPALAGDPNSLCYGNIDWQYLRENCRRVGLQFIPDKWRNAFNRYNRPMGTP